MKKLLATLSTMLLISSSLSTAACAFSNGAKQSIVNSMQKYVDIATLAAAPQILQDAANINRYWFFGQIKTNSINDIFTSWNDTDDNVTRIFNEYFQFGNTAPNGSYIKLDNTDFTNPVNNGYDASNTNIDWNGNNGEYVTDTNTLNTLSKVQMLITVLSMGFSPDLMSQITGLLNSRSIASTIGGLIPKVQNILTSDLFTNLASGFDDSAFVGKTYKECGWYLISEMNNAFFDLYEAAGITMDSENFKKIDLENITSQDALNAQKSVAIAINELIKGKLSISTNNLIGILVPEIIKLLGLLFNYIGQFNIGEYSLELKDTEIIDSQHLFSKEVTNNNVIKDITNHTYNPDTVANGKSSVINLQKILSYLQKFLGSSNSDSNGYQFQKLLTILFGDTSDLNFLFLPMTPSRTLIHYILFPIIDGALRSVDAISGNIEISNTSIPISQAITTILFGLFRDLGNGSEPDDVVKTLNKVASLGLSDSLKNLVSGLASGLENLGDRAYIELYNGTALKTILDSLGLSININLDNLNIKNILNANLYNLLTKLNIKIPSILYGLLNNSVDTIINKIAQSLSVSPDTPVDEYTRYIIDLEKIRNLLYSLAKTKDDLKDEYPWVENLKNSNNTTTDNWTFAGDTNVLVLALAAISSPNMPSAGVDGAMQLLGYDSDNNKFLDQTPLWYLQDLYVEGGMSQLFILIGQIVTKLISGASDYVDTYYAQYFDKRNFKNYNITNTITDDILQCTFNVNYTNPVTKEVFKYQITIEGVVNQRMKFKEFNKI